MMEYVVVSICTSAATDRGGGWSAYAPIQRSDMHSAGRSSSTLERLRMFANPFQKILPEERKDGPTVYSSIVTDTAALPSWLDESMPVLALFGNEEK